jgi:hypothetical protein
MNELDLIDIFRLKNPDKKRYTWRQPKPKICCRLDYFLISSNLMDFVTKVEILPSILSDHSPIFLSLTFTKENQRGPGHWKLNASLLNDQNYVSQMRTKIVETLDEHNSLNKNMRWEILKYEIRKFSISYSKKKKQKTDFLKKNLERQFLLLEQSEFVDETLRNEKQLKIKKELDQIHLDEAEGSIIRSRVQWRGVKKERNQLHIFLI